MIANTKVQSPVNRNGLFTKDAFDIDTDAGTVACPARRTVPIRQDPNGTGDGTARFGTARAACPLNTKCTTAKNGRTITVGRDHDILTAARARQADPEWKADYKATRPKIERKLAHLMRRRHGGRQARMRGTTKIDADFNLLAAAVNLARLAHPWPHKHPNRLANCLNQPSYTPGPRQGPPDRPPSQAELAPTPTRPAAATADPHATTDQTDSPTHRFTPAT